MMFERLCPKNILMGILKEILCLSQNLNISDGSIKIAFNVTNQNEKFHSFG